MALLSLAYIPLMDRRLHLLVSLKWATAPAMQWVFASGVAAFCATWSATLIFGMISALAHVLLGQVKTCSVVVVGAVFYDAHQTTGGIFGAAALFLTAKMWPKCSKTDPMCAQSVQKRNEKISMFWSWISDFVAFCEAFDVFPLV